MICPDCELELQRTKCNGRTVFQCPRCSGYVAEQHELVLATRREVTSPKPDPKCPRCLSETSDLQLLISDSESSESESLEKTLSLRQCKLCHAIWISSANLNAAIESESAADAVDQLRQELVTKALSTSEVASASSDVSFSNERQVDSEIQQVADSGASQDRPQSPVNETRSERQSELTDLLLVLAIMVTSTLTLFLKFFGHDWIAGFTFLLVTLVVVLMTWRFMVDSKQQVQVSGIAGVIGLIISGMIVWW